MSENIGMSDRVTFSRICADGRVMGVREIMQDDAKKVLHWLIDHDGLAGLIDDPVLTDPRVLRLIGAGYGHGFAKGAETFATQQREREAAMTQTEFLDKCKSAVQASKAATKANPKPKRKRVAHKGPKGTKRS